ncbi:ABC transporter ATP-binding protein [Demequina sp. TTPB684]|uniref:ABC transporter ATP-binding protein n=1 Tax=unclassified Demequina TaxID=2620311 RepID=UPI001CF3CE5B|nr:MULTISPECIES: ABC transporter ATP-binding protein [unclassified Demequina]MCB2412241.1 ABC transporter ATP-binding protein [Demequina sp. TTPB684]UPU87777.1 ABC transporter ATP-binding protein [Demequina sp. TMPB413]
MTDHQQPLPPHRLEAAELSLAYGSARVVHEVSVPIPPASLTAIIGPNGCGKSTLLRAMARLHKPLEGVVTLDGSDIHRRPTKEVARELGLLPQAPIAPAGITVKDLIARGRTPYLGAFTPWSSADTEAVTHALSATGLTGLAHRPVDSLSGGQRQRAWIALALAQDTEILLLDEPTTYLDIAHQYEVMDLLHALAAAGRTVVTVLHDLGQAARYADHVVLMSAGLVLARGTPAEVLTAQRVSAAFGLPVTVVPDPVTGTPLVVPSRAPLTGLRTPEASPDVVPHPERTP